MVPKYEGGLWLGNDGLAVEYEGQTLSRYDISLTPDERKLEKVTNPRLFATRYRSPQSRLFSPENALGEPVRLRLEREREIHDGEVVLEGFEIHLRRRRPRIHKLRAPPRRQIHPRPPVEDVLVPEKLPVGQLLEPPVDHRHRDLEFPRAIHPVRESGRSYLPRGGESVAGYELEGSHSGFHEY